MLRALGLHGPEAVGWLRGMFAFACWDPKERRLLLARDPLGNQAPLPGAVVGSGMRAGRWPSPRSFVPCWLPGFWARLASTRRPWPAVCGTASWSAPAPPSKASTCSGRAASLEFDECGQGGSPTGLLAYPRPRTRSDHGRGRSGRHPGGGAEASPRQRRAPGGLALQRRGLVSRRQPGPARGPEPHPYLHAGLRGGGAERGPDRQADRRRHRDPAPRGGADGGRTSSTTWRRRWTAWTSRPSTGSTPTTFRRAIRAAGFTVALSGTGGDELFGGYTSYRDLPVLHRWSRRAAWVPRSLQAAVTAPGHLAAATLRRDGAAADPLGQTSGDGPSRQ